ncbi:hypothetical protein PQO03_21265 [Lentisphaera profundi]|uniref:Aldose epimerase n=1 Tax=Lentisphaera profundi TaxID=1658616 RepID=A0ABY7VVU5_9BACT|nr:hypothetical protein [Lentisphaera profundi]WDE98345.1 hypothetical protein PQO03_21265 [Lentisphaera profundi]
MNEKVLATKLILGDENFGVVCDTYGAKILAFYVDGKNILFYEEDDISHSGIPLCFPSFGPLENNAFVWKGKTYPMKQHGFIRDNDFELLSQDESSLSLVLRSSQKTKERYPFDFEFIVNYQLTSDDLVMTYEFKNLSNESLPLAPGIHPYFAVDNPSEITFSSKAEKVYDNLQDYTLVAMDKTECFEDMGEQKYRIHGAPDLHIIGHNESKNILNLGNPKVEMTFDTNDFPRFTIWRKSADVPYICFEPANGKNALNAKPFLVPPNQSWKTSVSLKTL